MRHAFFGLFMVSFGASFCALSPAQAQVRDCSYGVQEIQTFELVFEYVPAPRKQVFKRKGPRVAPPTPKGGSSITEALQNRVTEPLKNMSTENDSETSETTKTTKSAPILLRYRVSPYYDNASSLGLYVQPLEPTGAGQLTAAEAKRLDKEFFNMKNNLQDWRLDLNTPSPDSKRYLDRINADGSIQLDVAMAFGKMSGGSHLRSKGRAIIHNPAVGYGGPNGNVAMPGKKQAKSLYDFVRTLKKRIDTRDAVARSFKKQTRDLKASAEQCKSLQPAHDQLARATAAIEKVAAAQGAIDPIANEIAGLRVTQTQQLSELAAKKKAVGEMVRYVHDKGQIETSPKFGEKGTFQKGVPLEDSIAEYVGRVSTIEDSFENNAGLSRREVKQAIANNSAHRNYSKRLKVLLAERERFDRVVRAPKRAEIAQLDGQVQQIQATIKGAERRLGIAQDTLAASLGQLRNEANALPKTDGLKKANAQMATYLEDAYNDTPIFAQRALKNAQSANSKEIDACISSIEDQMTQLAKTKNALASLVTDVDALRGAALCAAEQEMAKLRASGATAGPLMRGFKTFVDGMKKTSLQSIAKEDELKTRTGKGPDPTLFRVADLFDAVDSATEFMAWNEDMGNLKKRGWSDFSKDYKDAKGKLGTATKAANVLVKLDGFLNALENNDPQFVGQAVGVGGAVASLGGLSVLGPYLGYIGSGSEAVLKKGIDIQKQIRERDAKLLLPNPSKVLYSREQIGKELTRQENELNKKVRDQMALEYQVLRLGRLMAD
jgi:hypothetical protein